jgi:4'-phosphopantetheinyl transferase
LLLGAFLDDVADSIHDETLLALLPKDQAASIRKNVRVEDRKLRLLVRLLLAEGLRLLAGRPHAETLGELILDGLGRPCLPDSPWDFSFSHSGKAGVCLIGDKEKHGRLGVDVEIRRDLRPEDIASAFCAEERLFLDQQESQGEETLRLALFDLWTRKEAALKAQGSGLLWEPSRVNMLASCPLPSMPKLYITNLTLLELDGYSAACAIERGSVLVNTLIYPRGVKGMHGEYLFGT